MGGKMKKLKIALFQYPDYKIPASGYGPKQLIIELLARGFHKRGHKVSTFATADSQLPGEIIKISPKGINEGLNDNPEIQPDIERIYRSLAIGELIRRSSDFDIIHNHAGFTLLPVVQVLKSKVFHTLHGTYTNKHYRRIFKQYAQNGYYVPISNAQAKTLPPKVNCTEVIYHGIRINDFNFNSQPLEKTLLFLGRLAKIKGVHTAIRVAKQTGYKLIIAGPIDIARRGGKEYFAKEIKPHIDGKKIIYVGEVNHSQKKKLLRKSQALLFPVEWEEAFGLVMIEAMACGTQVIAYDCGSPAEIITDSLTGYICPKGDLEAMIEAVLKIDQIDRAVCRKAAEERFSDEKMVDNYLKLFMEKNEKNSKI